MTLYEGLSSLPTNPHPSTVALGAFDGIHLGHQAIIRHAVQDANRFNRSAFVFTFNRHPAELLAPDRAPDYLTTPIQRNKIVETLNVDGLVIAEFTLELSRLSPDAFIQNILLDKLSAKAIVVGQDFAFGYKRSGNVAFLKENQTRYGYTVHVLEPVVVEGGIASSTWIRELLRNGEIQRAEKVLGHPFWLAGCVVEGQKLGRTLGYPTANLALKHRQVVPCDGIYAVQARLSDGRLLNGACSIGNRPTVEGAGRSIETFFFDFNETIYDWEMELRFIAYLRPELKFDSLDELVIQMERDVQQAKMILNSKPNTI